MALIIIQLAKSRKNNIVEICIADTGIGISSAHMPKLFTPLYQVDASITRSYTGTGTALAVSKQLIEAMDGKLVLKASSAKARGFTLRCPQYSNCS